MRRQWESATRPGVHLRPCAGLCVRAGGRARALARAGAEVVMACRSLQRATGARQEILEDFPNAKIIVMHLDLAEMKSVRAFVEEFKTEYKHLDILANNAGVAFKDPDMTDDGFDEQFQTNHLSHFLLTALLWDRLIAAPHGGRVIQQSSSLADLPVLFDPQNLKSL